MRARLFSEAWLLSGAALPFLGSGFWPEPLGPNASEDGLRLSVTWEIFDFPTQRIRAAGIFGGAILVPLTSLDLPPDVLPRILPFERHPKVKTSGLCPELCHL